MNDSIKNPVNNSKVATMTVECCRIVRAILVIAINSIEKMA